MPKLEKVLNKKEVCPMCDKPIVCRMSKQSGNYPSKLQWQNEDGSVHYNKFNGEMYTCGGKGEQDVSAPKPQTRSAESTSSGKISPMLEFIQNYDFQELKEPEQEAVEKKAKKLFEQKLIVTKVAMEIFASAGFDNVASVGQVLTLINQ